MNALIPILVILFALLHASAWAETHALILTIGEYQNGVPPLQGSKYDVASARAIAKKMGVKDANMRFYKDHELTVEGMHKAFNELVERVGNNDQVFIYFSGHGGRWQMTEPENRCAASLVAVDGYGFMDTDMDAVLKRLSVKARKIVVFLDACHSGGVKTRGLTPAGWTPKFYSKGGLDSCEAPVNYITRNLNTQSRSIGKGINNYVFIAAARENEVSWDMGTTGGAATQAWRDCVLGAAQDKDGSGGLSAEEIGQCAQEKIDRMLKGFSSQGILPNHVTIAGNAKSVLAFSERAAPPPAAAAPVTPGPAAPPTIAPAPVAPSPVTTAPPAATPPQVALPAAYFTLADIYNNRDDRRVVTLQSAQAKFKVGTDNIGFTLRSDQPGYVYLLMVGTDGKTFDVLFPNLLDGNNEVKAGETLKLPRPAWSIKAAGPAGKNYLLAIVADAPRDFSKLNTQSAGPFSIVAANTTTARDIQRVTATSSQALANECQQPANKRTLAVQKRCSDGYGAVMTVLEETD